MALTSKKILALANTFTKETVEGAGAIKGKNCVIDSIEDITGGHRVTFKWTLDNGTVQTGTMDVMNGDKGDTGEAGPQGIQGEDGFSPVITVTEITGGHRVTITDAEGAHTFDVMDGQGGGGGAVSSVNGKTGAVVLNAEDVGALPDDTEIPSKTSDLTNDSNFVADASYVHTDNNYTNAEKAEVAKVADKADADDVIDGASYDSTNHLILFKNGATTLFSLDAAAFVKDGMVDDVEIEGGNLVITFNTDAGKQAISIPLADIFDPANYYTKTATDALLATKADETEVEEEIHGVNLNSMPYHDGMSKTNNGVTFTVNSDGSITANGTATGGYAFFACHYRTSPYGEVLPNGKYIMSGCTGGSLSTYFLGANSTKNGVNYNIGRQFDEEIEITLDGDDYYTDKTNVGFYFQVQEGQTVSNVTVRPMIRKADIEDSTYRPYNEQSIQNQINDKGVLGAKNLLPYPYANSSTTINGVTFTDNGDGTITANGTATSDAQFGLTNPTSNNPYVSMILSGDASGDETGTKYFLRDRVSNGGTFVTAFTDTGNGVTITTTDNTYNHQIQIVVRGGQTVSNLIFKPMLRLASDPDSTYQPYAMTNRELTEKLLEENLTSQIQWETGYFSPIANACKLIKYDGKYMFRLQGDIVQATGNTWVKIASLPITIPILFTTTFPVWSDKTHWWDMNIETNGDVQIRTQSLATGNLMAQLVL